MTCATVFPSNTAISMKLPDLASISTAEIWAIIKALEQIKNYVASKHIVFTLTFTYLNYVWSWNIPWSGWWYESVFFYFAIKDIIFCWVPSHIIIGCNKKADSAAKSALELPRAKVGVHYNDFFNYFLKSVYSFHLARWLKWCSCEQVSFCQASPGNLAVLLQAVQEGWSCLVSCPHWSYTFGKRSSTSVWALSV